MAEALPTGDGILIRSALLSDVTPLLALVNGYAAQGIMLPRTELELAENIRDFTIAAAGGALVGCGALHFYGTRTAEVRSHFVSVVLGLNPCRFRLIGRLAQSFASDFHRPIRSRPARKVATGITVATKTMPATPSQPRLVVGKCVPPIAVSIP